MAGTRRIASASPALSAWLGAGAVALGLGAALAAGTGAASADTGASGSSPGSERGSTSASSSTGSDSSAGNRESGDTDATSAGPRNRPSPAATGKRTAPRTVLSARKHTVPATNHEEPLVPEAPEAEPQGATVEAPRAVSTTTVKATAAAPATPDPFDAFTDAVNKAIQRAFYNVVPTVVSASGPTRNSDGSFSGQVVGADADGDPLRYGLYDPYTPPTRGTVVIDAAGNYTYTPDAELAVTGGRVSLNLYVEEANAGSHVHGLDELMRKVFDPVYQFLNILIPQNRFKFPKYDPTTYARTYRYVTITIPPAGGNGSQGLSV